MDHLNRYDRATVGLWARSHAELAGSVRQRYLAQVAVHALLASLCHCSKSSALFARYEADAAADFALIGSLLSQPLDELRWWLRDAAFHLRWRELTDEPD